MDPLTGLGLAAADGAIRSGTADSAGTQWREKADAVLASKGLMPVCKGAEPKTVLLIKDNPLDMLPAVDPGQNGYERM
eukprot:4621983-Prymnesium_polylepis.1